MSDTLEHASSTEANDSSPLSTLLTDPLYWRPQNAASVYPSVERLYSEWIHADKCRPTTYGNTDFTLTLAEYRDVPPALRCLLPPDQPRDKYPEIACFIVQARNWDNGIYVFTDSSDAIELIRALLEEEERNW